MRRLSVPWFHVPAAAVILAAACTHANAQQNTTATYADWVLQCSYDQATPPKKTCEMTQVTQVQGKNVPYSRVLIETPAKGHPLKLVVQVPVNVSLRSQVTIRIGDADSGISAPFDHCIPGGCFAEFEVKDETLKKFYAGEGPGKVSFKDSSGTDVGIPLSFKGFHAAYDALSKE
jgi:invasion protein IalB